MAIRYRDIPTVPISISPEADSKFPIGVRWGAPLIDSAGEAFLTTFELVGNWTICDARSGTIVFQHSFGKHGTRAKFDRFPDGRCLMIESRAEPDYPNAYIFHKDGTLAHRFHAGDGINSVQADGQGKI